jgi:hypothetical protein
MRASRLAQLRIQNPALIGDVSGLPEDPAAAPKVVIIPAGPTKAEQHHLVDRAVAATPKWLRGLAGTMYWRALHRRALKVPAGRDDAEWLATFRRMLPCGDCRNHWDAMVAATPPEWANYFAWTVARHNEVNRRLGKPEMGEEEALQRWSKGLAGPLQASDSDAPAKP